MKQLQNTYTQIVTKNKKAFTLVELIIVITILAILATISFVSFQGFTRDARDANRTAAMKNIETGLEIYVMESGKYPVPDGFKTAVFSGTDLVDVFYQGEFGQQVVGSIGNISSVPLDPLTKKNYVYSTTSNQHFYQIATVIESENYLTNDFPKTNFGIQKTYAHSPKKAKVIGNYYASPFVPSLILANIKDKYVINENKNDNYWVYNNSENLPYSLNGEKTTNISYEKDFNITDNVIGLVEHYNMESWTNENITTSLNVTSTISGTTTILKSKKGNDLYSFNGGSLGNSETLFSSGGYTLSGGFHFKREFLGDDIFGTKMENGFSIVTKIKYSQQNSRGLFFILARKSLSGVILDRNTSKSSWYSLALSGSKIENRKQYNYYVDGKTTTTARSPIGDKTIEYNDWYNYNFVDGEYYTIINVVDFTKGTDCVYINGDFIGCNKNISSIKGGFLSGFNLNEIRLGNSNPYNSKVRLQENIILSYPLSIDEILEYTKELKYVY